MGTAKYLLGKLGQLFITLILVLSLAFLLFRVWQPGDPVATWAKASGAKLNAEQLDQIRHEWGLDVPLPRQYVSYMGQMLTFNFGTSTILNPQESVSSMFWSRMAKSAILIVTSTFAAIAIGVLLGIYGGWKRQGESRPGLDELLDDLVRDARVRARHDLHLDLRARPCTGSRSASTRVAIPKTGLSHWTDVINHMALPWLTLTPRLRRRVLPRDAKLAAGYLGEEYIALARAKGVREKYVLRKHAVPNALLPTITLVALSFGFILSGVITVELRLQLSGRRQTLGRRATARDFAVLQATFVISVIAVLLANFIADLTYAYLDPRVRRA